MKAIKNMDFFQKISIDNIAKPTMLGSLLSISAIVITTYLIINEIIDLFTPKIKKQSIVYHDKDQTSKIKVNLSIRLNNVPCHIISVDQEDSIGNHVLDVSDTLYKSRIDQKALVINTPLDEKLTAEEELERAIINSEGCFIEGHVPISKVPGNIHVSFHKYGELFMWLKFQRPDLFEKIFLNHRVNAFYFGSYGIKMKLLNSFGYNENTAFNRPEAFPNNLKELSSKSYDYYFKIIPHLFDDQINGEKIMGYQYSITHKKKDFDNSSQSYEMPIIMFNYDFSPITMMITKESKNLLHGLTHICAIVGGVFIIFSILNRVLLSIFSTDKINQN